MRRPFLCVVLLCVFGAFVGCGGGGGDTTQMKSEEVGTPPASQEDLDKQMEAEGYDPSKEGN